MLSQTLILKEKKRESYEVPPLVMRQCLWFWYGNSDLFQSTAHFVVRIYSVVTYILVPGRISREEGVLKRKWASCVYEQEGVGWLQFQVLLGTTALLKSFSRCLCERVIFITSLKINSILVLCSAPRNQACSEVWERESKWNLMVKGEKARIVYHSPTCPLQAGCDQVQQGNKGWTKKV